MQVRTRVAECLCSGDSSLLSSVAAAAAAPDKGASLAALQLLNGTCSAYPPLCCAAAAAGLPQARHLPQTFNCFGRPSCAPLCARLKDMHWLLTELNVLYKMLSIY